MYISRHLIVFLKLTLTIVTQCTNKEYERRGNPFKEICAITPYLSDAHVERNKRNLTNTQLRQGVQTTIHAHFGVTLTFFSFLIIDIM